MNAYGRFVTGVVLFAAMVGGAHAGTPIDGFTETPVATGLNLPTAIAFLPDGRLLVTEKSGALRLVESGVASTLVNIPVCGGDEMGLLGIALDPAFASNGFIYLYRTKPPAGGCGSSTGRFNQVVRVTMVSDTINISSLVELLSDMRTDNGNHNGGVVRIGPDNKLYVGVGDTGAGDNQGCPGSSTNVYSQDLNRLEGKVLRLNLDGSPPTDNPFFGQVGKRGEIYASGFRNPFRFGFDPTSGNLWLGDVGDLAFEEIDVVVAGGNYAFPHCEGTHPNGCEQAGDVDPIFEYSHNGGCAGESNDSLGTSITGGAFAGASFGGLENDYFFGDFTGSAIYHAEPNATRNGIVGAPTEFVSGADGPVDIIFGPGGALYYVAINDGEVRRVAPAIPPPSDIDHYLCYRATLAPRQPALPKNTIVQLEDEFDGAPRPFNVMRAASLCNPASKNGSTVLEPDAHQESYVVKRTQGSPKYAKSNHVTFDQFATRNLNLMAEDSLLVPSSKALGSGGAPAYAGTTVDHYKCYRAALAPGSPKFIAPPPPTISDQFWPSGQSFKVTRVTKVCNPVSADGSAINHSASHLVCYQVQLPNGVKFTKQTVSTNNPDFGDDVLTVMMPYELCVPAALP